MNIEVGDIIKIENNKPVPVSTSLTLDFSFSVRVSWGTHLALLLPMLLVNFSCLTLHMETNSNYYKMFVPVNLNHNYS